MPGTNLRIASMQLRWSLQHATTLKAFPRFKNAHQALQNDRMTICDHLTVASHGRSSFGEHLQCQPSLPIFKINL
jgi:lipoate-protein ligase B